MENEQPMNLPEGFNIAWDYWMGPSYRDGSEILNNYCASCRKETDCKMYSRLRHAMGENYPLWFNEFVPIEVQDEIFCSSEIKILCTEYQDKQMRLPNFPNDILDGVERLMFLVEQDKAQKRYEDISSPFGLGIILR